MRRPRLFSPSCLVSLLCLFLAVAIISTAHAQVPQAPLDLTPKNAQVTLSIPANTDLKGAAVTVECSGEIPEITLLNNQVVLW